MIANEMKNPWPYLLVRMFAITFIATPILTGIFTTLISIIHGYLTKQNGNIDLSTRLYLSWGYTFIAFTWTLFLFVLIPYNFIYLRFKLNDKHVLLRYFLFYILLLIMGVLLPDATIIDFYSANPYPRILALYLLLTLTLCPLCNLALNKVLLKSTSAQTEN